MAKRDVYGLPWTRVMVRNLFARYPEATELMSRELGVTAAEIVDRWIHYQVDWPRYKKLLREIEKALNTCVVVSVEKVRIRWEICVKPVDTPQGTLDYGRAPLQGP